MFSGAIQTRSHYYTLLCSVYGQEYKLSALLYDVLYWNKILLSVVSHTLYRIKVGTSVCFL